MRWFNYVAFTIAAAMVAVLCYAVAHAEDSPFIIKPQCEARIVAAHALTMPEQDFLAVADWLEELGRYTHASAEDLRALIREAYTVPDLNAWAVKRCSVHAQRAVGAPVVPDTATRTEVCQGYSYNARAGAATQFRGLPLAFTYIHENDVPGIIEQIEHDAGYRERQGVFVMQPQDRDYDAIERAFIEYAITTGYNWAAALAPDAQPPSEEEMLSQWYNSCMAF